MTGIRLFIIALALWGAIAPCVAVLVGKAIAQAERDTPAMPRRPEVTD